MLCTALTPNAALDAGVMSYCVYLRNPFLYPDMIQTTFYRPSGAFYQISSDDLTISKVGVLGFMLFMRLRSALVTSEGVIGIHGVCG